MRKRFKRLIIIVIVINTLLIYLSLGLVIIDRLFLLKQIEQITESYYETDFNYDQNQSIIFLNITWDKFPLKYYVIKEEEMSYIKKLRLEHMNKAMKYITSEIPEITFKEIN